MANCTWKRVPAYPHAKTTVLTTWGKKGNCRISTIKGRHYLHCEKFVGNSFKTKVIGKKSAPKSTFGLSTLKRAGCRMAKTGSAK